MAKSIQVCDLPEGTLDTGVFLYCNICDAQYSATRGDYFWRFPDSKLLCCGEPMMLARERILIEEVS